MTQHELEATRKGLGLDGRASAHLDECVALLNIQLGQHDRITLHLRRELVLLHLLVEELEDRFLGHRVVHAADVEALGLAHRVDDVSRWEGSGDQGAWDAEVRWGRNSAGSVREHAYGGWLVRGTSQSRS